MCTLVYWFQYKHFFRQVLQIGSKNLDQFATNITLKISHIVILNVYNTYQLQFNESANIQMQRSIITNDLIYIEHIFIEHDWKRRKKGKQTGSWDDGGGGGGDGKDYRLTESSLRQLTRGKETSFSFKYLRQVFEK